jgi:hypothetical protein
VDLSIVRFSLRSLLILTTLVSLFLALRSSYLFGNAFAIAVFRAHQLPPLFAALSVVISASCLSIRRTRDLVLLGSGVSLLVATILAAEITEGLRRIAYWNWYEDWTTFLQIIGCHAVLGAGIGFAVSIVFRWVRSQRRSPADRRHRRY